MANGDHESWKPKNKLFQEIFGKVKSKKNVFTSDLCKSLTEIILMGGVNQVGATTSGLNRRIYFGESWSYLVFNLTDPEVLHPPNTVLVF